MIPPRGGSLRGELIISYEKSIADAIKTWAPAAAGNDPVKYAENVHTWTGVDPQRKAKTLTPDEMEKLKGAIKKQEGYIPGTTTIKCPDKN